MVTATLKEAFLIPRGDGTVISGAHLRRHQGAMAGRRTRHYQLRQGSIRKRGRLFERSHAAQYLSS